MHFPASMCILREGWELYLACKGLFRCVATSVADKERCWEFCLFSFYGMMPIFLLDGPDIIALILILDHLGHGLETFGETKGDWGELESVK